jgi:hypothetical protein
MSEMDYNTIPTNPVPLDNYPWCNDFGNRFEFGVPNINYFGLVWAPRSGYEQDRDKYPHRGLYVDPEPYTPSLDEARSDYQARNARTGRATWDESGAQFDRMIESVRAEERERAARIADGFEYHSRAAGQIAARIREGE